MGARPHLRQRIVAAPRGPESGRRHGTVLDHAAPAAATALELRDAVGQRALERRAGAGEVVDLVAVGPEVVELPVTGRVLHIEEMRGADGDVVRDLRAP